MGLFAGFGQKNNGNRIRVKPAAGGYYERVSVRYHALTVFLVIVLVLTVFTNFFVNKGLFTYSNLFYLFKDIQLSPGNGERTYAYLSYPESQKQSFALYKNGLTVAGSQNLTVFSSSGKQTLQKSVSFSNPVVIASDAYALIYDLGEKQVSVSNLFSVLWSDTTENPITTAAICNAGYFALVTKGSGYRSSVKVYDNDFNLISSYGKNKPVIAVSLDASGSHIAMCAVHAVDGVATTEVSVIRRGENDYTYKIDLPDFFALQSAYTSSGNLLVLGTTGLICLSSAGQTLSQISFEGKELFRASLDENGALAVINTDALGQTYRLLTVDRNGRAVYDESWNISLCQAVRYGGIVFLSTEKTVIRLDTESGEKTEMDFNGVGKTLLACSENEVVFCSGLQADYNRFDS